MANFTVMNANDSGAGSLRQAVLDANAMAGADTITFDPGVFSGGTLITLTTGELQITQSINIDGDTNGDERPDVLITANGNSRIFNFDTGIVAIDDVTLESLSLAQGYTTAFGGAIYMKGVTSATLNYMSIQNSYALRGGGIHAVETDLLTIYNSTIFNSGATFYGGGIDLVNTEFKGVNMTVTQNFSLGDGGGIATTAGTSTAKTTLINSTIIDNDSSGTYFTAHSGGISVFSNRPTNPIANGELTLKNTVAAFNTIQGYGYGAGYDAAVRFNSGVISAYNSFFSTTTAINGGYGSNINNGGNPFTGILYDFGGPVPIMTPLGGSPLIDAGNSLFVPPGVNYDANLFPRIQGASVDIGAAEFF